MTEELKFHSEFTITDLGIQEQDVYDIEVADVHNFFGNNILVHNSCYVCLSPIMEKFVLPRCLKEDGSIDLTKAIDTMNKISIEKITPAINACCDKLGSYSNTMTNLMNFKREALADRGVWCCHPDTQVVVDLAEFAIKDLWIQGKDTAEDGVRSLEGMLIDGKKLRAVYRKEYTGKMVTIITDQGSSVTVTAEHLVWCNWEWVRADSIKVGDRVQQYDMEGDMPEVIHVAEFIYDGYVYDLEVDGMFEPAFYANNIYIHNCAKKRYAIQVHDNEGVRYTEPKIKVMGLEIVRTSTPKPVRQMLKDAVKIVLTGTEQELQEFCADQYDKYIKLPPEDIAYPRGVQRLQHYSNASSIYAKGCPIHVRASLLYNHYIKEHGLGEVYQEIQDGDKIKFIMLKVPNTIRENCIGFIGKFPRELGLERYVDYDEMWEKSFVGPLKNVIDTIQWTHKEQASLMSLFD